MLRENLNVLSLENWIGYQSIKELERNEEADILAKQGFALDFVGPEPAVGIPVCLAKIDRFKETPAKKG